MNWYSLTKQAAPLYESDTLPVSYLDIGHQSEDDAQLWLIDENFSFFSVPVYSNGADWDQEIEGKDGSFDDIDMDSKRQHATWKKYTNDYYSMIASGRYDNGVVSLTFPNNFTTKSFFSHPVLKKRVLKILDKEFNNPTIYDYS